MADFDNPAISKRRPWWIAAAVLALLALTYSALWFTLALNSRDKVLHWIEAQHAQGFTARYDSLEVAGFPLAIRLEFSNPGFGAPNVRHPWGWEGAHLSLFLKPWDINTIIAETSGPQMLAIPIDGKTETYNGEVLRAQATLSLSGGQPKGFDVRLEQTALEAETAGLAAIRISQAHVQVERLVAGKTGHQTASARLEVTLQGAEGPWLTASPLGGTVQRLSLDARQMGSFDQGPLIEALENWRDRGGTIEIAKVSLQHGPLQISADGTLALDERLQPIGALTARVVGFFEAIDALHRLGAVTPRDAITAKMVLGVLSRKSSSGGPAHLNLALSAQGNTLYAGPIGLMKIAEIDWRPHRK